MEDKTAAEGPSGLSGAFAWLRLWTHYVAASVVLAIAFRALVSRLIFVRDLSAIPGPFGLPILGNSLSLTGGQEAFFRLLLHYRKAYGSIFKLWIGTRAFVFISDARYVGSILNSNLHIDKSYEYTFLHPWLGTGLLTATGSKWHNRRKLLTPTFHHSLLEEFIEPIVKKSQILVRLLQKEVEREPFNVLNYTKLCALDIICVTAMGKDIEAQICDGSDYVRAVEGLNKILQRRFITPWLKPDFIFDRSSLGKKQRAYIRTINNFVSKVIEEKKMDKSMNAVIDEVGNESKNEGGDVDRGRGRGPAFGGRHLAFLDFILRTADAGNILSDDDIREEVNTFMFAGHDTTSVAISWCLYALGKHLPAQERVLEEYEAVVKGDIPNYRELQKLEYLECCIKETLRLYPVVPLIARDIKHRIQISESTSLLPGVTALIFTPSLHRDASVFQDPDEFRPERFASDFRSANPFSYIPFSAGPRNCIGAKFAMIQVKIVLYHILKNYEIVSVDAENQLNLMSEIVLLNKEGIRIVLKNRGRRPTATDGDDLCEPVFLANGCA